MFKDSIYYTKYNVEGSKEVGDPSESPLQR